jgi:hypothetical protein
MDAGLWQSSATNSSWENPACETDVRNFRKCMDENQGNMSICGWYLDQLVCPSMVVIGVERANGFIESLPGGG